MFRVINYETKIERLTYKSWIDYNKSQNVKIRYEKEDVLPVEFIQEYIDGKLKDGWKIKSIVPIYIPSNIKPGANWLMGIDYYWEM